MSKNKTAKNIRKIEFFAALIFILIGAGLRLLPHAPNFTPIAAIALFAGVYFSRKAALILPLLAMAVSDIFIGYYDFWVMISVYGSFLLFVALGFWLKKHKKWHTIAGSAFLSAVLFFLITNFAVWVFTPWYAKTLSGIIQCYLLALPFLKNTLLGNLFYTLVFFGGYELIEVWIKSRLMVKKKALSL